jgi:hypothetical protein
MAIGTTYENSLPSDQNSDFGEVESAIWPQVLMVVIGVYVILHILSDSFKVLQWCTSFHQQTSNAEDHLFKKSAITEAATMSGASSGDHSYSCYGGVHNVATVSTAQTRTGVPVRDTGTTGGELAGRPVVGQASSPAESRPTSVPCKCANEEVHVCDLEVCQTCRVQSLQQVPKIWTTTEGVKYHLFEQCAGQNNVGPRFCRVMCAHCLRKRNKQL